MWPCDSSFCKQKHWFLLKSSMKLISSKCSSLWLTTYLLFFINAFQQTVVIPKCTNCVPFLVDLLLYPYETDFTQGLLKKKQKPIRFLCNYIFVPHNKCSIWNKRYYNKSSLDKILCDIYSMPIKVFPLHTGSLD